MTLIMLIFGLYTKVQLLGNIDKATLKLDLYWRRIYFISKIYQSCRMVWNTSPISKIMLTKILIWVSLRFLWCFNHFCDFIYYLIYESEYHKIKVGLNPCTFLIHWSFKRYNLKCFLLHNDKSELTTDVRRLPNIKRISRESRCQDKKSRARLLIRQHCQGLYRKNTTS